MKAIAKLFTLRGGVLASPAEVLLSVLLLLLVPAIGYVTILTILRYSETLEMQVVNLVRTDLENAIVVARMESQSYATAYADLLAEKRKTGLSPAAISVFYDHRPPISGYNHFVMVKDQGLLFQRFRVPSEVMESSYRILEQSLPWDLAIAEDRMIVVSLSPVKDTNWLAGFYLEITPATRAPYITIELRPLSRGDSIPRDDKRYILPLRNARESPVALATISTRGYLSAIRGKLWWTLSFLLLIVAYGAFLLTRNTILFFGVRPVRDYVEHLREALERGGPLRKMEATGEPGLDALSEQINSLVSRMRDTQLREISQLKELRFVQRLSESLLRVTSRRDLAQVLVDELHRAIGKGAVVLRLLRSDRTALECVAHTGIPDDLIEETWVLPVGKGLAGRVVLAEAPVLIEDYNNAGLRASDRPSPFYYAYCAPIRSGSETIGTLSVLTPEQFPITQSMRRTLDIATQEFGVVYRGLTAVLRLRELKDFNDQILENMSEGIVVESSDGTIEYVNPFLLRLLGVRTRSAVIGKRLDQWMKSSERASADRVPQIPADALASYETYILPEGNTAKRAVRVTSTYLSGEGNYPRRLSVVTDITEIKEREALIERNRQFLLTLTNAIPAAIVVLGRGGEIIFYNSTFRQAFVTGGSDSITGTVDPVLASKLDEVLRQGASIVGQEFEQEPGPRNPRKRYWRLSAIHMPERDEVLCVLVDVSDERELARKIAETEKLIVLGEMVTRVSHQINNPLTGVIGNAELLLSEFPEGTEPYEMATLILHSADRIRKVLASLEMFIRKPFETGSTFSLNTLVTDAVTLFERSLGRRGIQLETVLDPALPQIRGDPFQVRQALINLITNSDQAYEEARKGGIIRVQTRWLPDTREALLVVQDWATGMSEVVKARALEPFFTTRSTDQNATGMGLPVAYGIVRAHGGSMQIESEVGQGTTVSLRFPVPLHLESETPTGQDVPFVRTDTLENLRILLVEDEVEVVLPLKRFLESERAIVEMARSGQEALNCVASRDYDAILLDLHLPDCHGLEIIEHLSTTHPGLLRGVLVITGLVLEAREEECLNHKRIPTLRKPFSMTDLKRAILVRLYGDLAQPSSA